MAASKPNLHARGILLTAIGVLVLTPDSLLVRLISCDPWTLLFWRGLLQFTAIFLFYAAFYRRNIYSTFKSIGLPGLLISTSYAIGNMLFVHSIRTTTAANTLFIVSASPLIAALLSRILLKEKTPAHTVAASMLCLAGVGVIVSGGFAANSWQGDFLALLTALSMACSFVMIRKARAVNMVPAVALSGLLMSAATFPLAGTIHITPRDAGLLFLLGFVVMPVAFGLITLGPRYISAPEVSLIMLIETVLGPVWVWTALGELPHKLTYIGGAMVLATLITHSIVSMKKLQRDGQPG